MIVDFFVNLYFWIWRKASLSSYFPEPALSRTLFSLCFRKFHDKTQITLDSGQFVLCLIPTSQVPQITPAHLTLYVFPCGNFDGPLCVLNVTSSVCVSLLTLDNICSIYWDNDNFSTESIGPTSWPYVFPCGNFEGPLCTFCTPVSQNNQWCHWVHQRYTTCQRFDKFWF